MLKSTVRRRSPVVLVLAMSLLAAACSGGDDGANEVSAVDQLEPTPTPVPSQAPTEPDPADGSDDGAAANDGAAVDESADGTDDGATTDEGAVDVGGDPDAAPTTPPDVDLTEPAFTERSKISTVGLDEVFFGMLADEAAAAAGTVWETDGATTSSCYVVTPANGPAGVSFTIWSGTVERVDVSTELITTRSGAGVGSTPDGLRELFGDLLDETDPARVVFIPADDEDAEFRINFDIENGAVTSYSAGRLPIVDLDGCPT